MDINRIIEIDFQRCFKALIVYFKAILISTLAFILLGIGFACIAIPQQDEYTAHSSVYSIVYGSYSESTESLQTMIAYADIVKSYKVAERACLLLGDKNLDAETINNMISAEYENTNYTYTSIIDIYAKAPDRQTAVKVSNAVTEAFVLEIASLTGKEDVKQLDKAYDAEQTYNSTASKFTTIGIFAVLGLILSCAFIFIREVFSTKMYSPKDASLYGTLDVFGVIPKFK